MKLPFIILRTADHDRLQKENCLLNIMHHADTNLVHGQLELLHKQYDIVDCLLLTLAEYEQAMEQMTQQRKLSSASRDYWMNETIRQCDRADKEYQKANEWRNRYDMLAAEMARTATARTTEPEPQPAELAEQEELIIYIGCDNCDFDDVGIDYEPCYSCHNWSNWKPQQEATTCEE